MVEELNHINGIQPTIKFTTLRKGTVEELNHINGIQPTMAIKFTVELEELLGTQKEGEWSSVNITYVAGMNKDIRRVAGSLDRIGKQSNVVYHIAYSCSQVYIGETMQTETGDQTEVTLG